MPKPWKILVADDDPEMLVLILQSLKPLHAQISEASDGEQALQLARQQKPDLVVLDVMMPAMSGWEVCRAIRDEPTLQGTGVIMLTGIGERLNEMTSPLYGADDYLDKPFDLAELAAKARKVLDARHPQD